MAISTEWAAGFLDGEGCLSIGLGRTHRSGKRIYYLRLSVHQMVKRPLEALVERWGGSLRLVTSHKPSPIWEWVVSGTTAARVMSEVLPFLLVKREQAELGLTFQSRKSERGCGNSSSTSEDELSAQHILYEQMRALKKAI